VTFYLDRNRQLRLQLPYDVKTAAGQPDTVVFTREQTEELIELLRTSSHWKKLDEEAEQRRRQGNS
jgi:hypothetical protein